MYWFICTTHPRKPTDPLILPICSSCFFREIKFRRSGLEHPTGLDGVAGLMFIMCIYIYIGICDEIVQVVFRGNEERQTIRPAGVDGR